MESTIPDNTLIIGAGLTGLATAATLKRRGVPVTVLEAQSRVAEGWRKRHPALRLNIHRHFARLPGRKPPHHDGAYLKRDTVVAYLSGYARQIGVPIRFGVRVEKIERDITGWRVQTGRETFHGAHVVMAAGRNGVPHLPDWPGVRSFTGDLIHAAGIASKRIADGITGQQNAPFRRQLSFSPPTTSPRAATN